MTTRKSGPALGQQAKDQPLGTPDRTFGSREAFPRDVDQELERRVTASEAPSGDENGRKGAQADISAPEKGE